MRLPKKFSQTSRRVFYFIHLWTGLILGLWLVMMGLTGSLLSFKYELTEWEARQRVSAPPPAPGAKIIPVSEAIAALKAVDPDLGPERGIYLPTRPSGYYWLSARGMANGERVTHIYLVDPVTARVYPPVVSSTLWIEITEQIHHNLLAGVKGTVTNGWGTFFTLFLLISGAWLWWPSNGRQLLQRIRWKRGASFKRALYDWHNISGVYLYGILFVVTVTGVLICYNGQTDQSIRKAVNGLAGVPEQPERPGPGRGAGERGQVRPGGRPPVDMLPVDVLVEKARAALPGNPLVSIRTPRRPGDPFRASYEYIKISRGGVPFDPVTGERLRSSNEAAFGRPASPGTTIMGMVFHLHYGWFAGNWSKVLYCLTGFMPLVLFVTGIWMWISKKQAQRQNRVRRRQREQALREQGLQEEMLNEQAPQERVLVH